MSGIPKRGDAIYLEIEKFADYELTSCIAYEMAIRAGAQPIEYDSTDYNNDKLIVEKPRTSDIHLFGTTYLDTALYTLIPDIREKIMISESIKNDIEGNDETSRLVEDLEYIIINFITNPEIEFEFVESTFEGDEALTKEKLLSIIKAHKHVNRVIPSFSRPRMRNLSNVEVEFNLNVPIEDNIALLKHIKLMYDHGRDSKFMPLPVFMHKFKSINNIDTKLTNSFKMANMFYIYDAKKASVSLKKIRDEIQDRRIDVATTAHERKKVIRPDPKTVNALYELAEEYIDTKQYRELTLGRIRR